MTDEQYVSVEQQKQLLAFIQEMFPPAPAESHLDMQMTALARILCAIAKSRGVHVENLKAHFETIYEETDDAGSTRSH